MVYTLWTKKHLMVVALVAVCGLLAGCSPVMDGGGSGGTGQGGSSEGQHNPDSSTSHGDESGAASDRLNPGGASGDGEASCLVGTWKEDLAVLTSEMIKKMGGDVKVKWSGDVFLRFDDAGGFYNWAEDSVFESWLGGDHLRTVVNGVVVGDYAVKSSVIHWSNMSTLFSETVLHSNGVAIDGENADLADNYRYPASFSCAKDKLVAHLGSAELTIPRVFYRSAVKGPSE